jgi:hypothetical protein
MTALLILLSASLIDTATHLQSAQFHSNRAGNVTLAEYSPFWQLAVVLTISLINTAAGAA